MSTFNCGTALSTIANIDQVTACSMATQAVDEVREEVCFDIRRNIELGTEYVLAMAGAARRLEGVDFVADDADHLRMQLFACDRTLVYEEGELQTSGMNSNVANYLRAAVAELVAG